jgi:predicted enzyme related to lactoylglutathione lyase
MAAGMRQAGEFCWINMLTPQSAEARDFFSALFGWTYAEIPGLGHTIMVGSQPIGGLFDLAHPTTPKGTQAHIGVMVKVESAEAACERVSSLGGQARAPFDIANQLRMAVCHDPVGAEFDVWEPKNSHGTEADTMHHGVPSWFETLTSDLDRARHFYSALFGWTPEVAAMPGRGDRIVFKRGSAPVAAATQTMPVGGGPRPHWATYFTANDVDAIARDAVAHGAKLCVPVRDVPGVGRMCGITSPQGVMFCAVRYEN